MYDIYIYVYVCIYILYKYIYIHIITYNYMTYEGFIQTGHYGIRRISVILPILVLTLIRCNAYSGAPMHTHIA